MVGGLRGVNASQHLAAAAGKWVLATLPLVLAETPVWLTADLVARMLAPYAHSSAVSTAP